MKKQIQRQKRIEREGIYLLPNLFTSLGLFCGFLSIISSFNGKYPKAAYLILLSFVFDGLDGRIARKINTTTRFGVEYDSLSDMVAFSIAPAILAYSSTLNAFGRWGILACSLYVICGALRLARFNLQVDTIETRYFQGMPTPAAAGLVATTVILFNYLALPNTFLEFPLLFLCLVTSPLMVSKMRYLSLKGLQLSKKRSLNTLLVLLFLLMIIVAKPQWTLFFLFSLYLFFGPIDFLWGFRNRRVRKEKARLKLAHIEKRDLGVAETKK